MKMPQHRVKGGLREAALLGMRYEFDDLMEGDIPSDGLGEMDGIEAEELWSREMCKNQMLLYYA